MIALNKDTLRQFFVFGCVGIAATLTHYFVAVGSLETMAISLYAANLTGYCSAAAISYFFHVRFTFKTRLSWVIFLRFSIASITILILSEVILLMLETWAQLTHRISLAVVVLTVPAITFVISKLWVFQENKRNQKD